MKLYTEEQVRKAIKLSLINAKLFIHKWLGKDDKYFPTVDEGINTITPIELPSDEDIREGADDWVFKTPENNWSNNNDEAGDNFASFIRGAKWTIEQISNRKYKIK